MQATAPRARSRPDRLLALLPTALAVVLLVIAVRWFGARWDAVMSGGERPPVEWRWLLVAFGLLVLHAGTAVLIWRQVLRAVGAPLTLRQALDSLAPSLLARYVPGKIWANTVRVALGRRAGVRLGASTGAILWETLVALGSAGVVALGCLAVNAAVAGAVTGAVAVRGFAPVADATAVRAAAALAAGAIGAWVAVALLARHPRGAALLHRLGGTDPVRSLTALAPAVATSLAGWAIYGAAHLAIARSVAPVGLGEWPLVAGAVALAWAGGYLAFVMPVGLGVRDGLLIVLLAPLLDPARALLLVALSRLVQLAVDAAITAGWILRQSARAAPVSSATPPSA